MQERLSFNAISVIAAIMLALVAIGVSEKVVADTTCPNPGERPALPGDAVVQTGQIPVGTCYNPNTVGINQSSEQAKQLLSSMVCGSGINIQGLDANFAVCAAKFMTALRQVSPGACIRSAYRDVQQQLNACMGICGQSSCPGKCAAPGTSYHQRGLAIDVNVGVSNSVAWQVAINSTGGGIANPSGLHQSDPNHFQATSASCSGSPVPMASQTDYYPTTPFSSPLSSAPIAAPTQQPATVSPTSNPFTNSPIPASQYPQQMCSPQYYCSANTLYYRASDCSTQTMQTCQYGCSGTACLPAPTSTSTSNTQPLVSPTTIGTTNSLALNTNLTQSVQQGFGQPTGSSSVITTIVAGTSSAAAQTNPPIAQSTFQTSNAPAANTSAPSPVFMILNALKSALLNILTILRVSGPTSSL